jgi:hypothetical protein
MGNGPSTVYYLISVVLLLASSIAEARLEQLYQKNDYNQIYTFFFTSGYKVSTPFYSRAQRGWLLELFGKGVYRLG